VIYCLILGSHGGEFEERYQKPVGRMRQAELLAVIYLAYFSTLTTEALRFFETSVDFYRATRRYIPEEVFLKLVHFQRSDFAKYLTKILLAILVPPQSYMD
jgi:hypothetical protein